MLVFTFKQLYNKNMSLLKVPYNHYQSFFSTHFDIYKVGTNDILESMKIFKFFQKNKKKKNNPLCTYILKLSPILIIFLKGLQFLVG